MEKDFNTLYESLRPTLTLLEGKRLELKAKGTKTGLIAGGICCLLGVILSLYTGAGWVGLIVTVIISGIILYSCINSKGQELSEFYKKNVISAIVSELCQGAVFEPSKGISQGAFEGSGLFQSPDRYSSEDLISGQRGATSFLCSEIHAEKKQVTTDGKGRTRTHWVDIFKGFFFIADFQKDFKGKTTIYRNALIKLHFGEQRVKLENPEFEDSFDVYSTDQVEARYLLTPSFMECLLTLDRKFKETVTVSFRNSNVIIAIPDQTNHFEASIWQSVLSTETLKREFDTLLQLTGIIDDLNLNTRIWTKE